MAEKRLTRDEIALRIFGRKFRQLDDESQSYVQKTFAVMQQANRTGGDSDSPVRQAAFKETVSIVKQLKQIAANPGDMIELPSGILQDAARVIHYQSQALNRGRVLDSRDMAEIKKEVTQRYRSLNPKVVEGIVDYLTNTTGRFSGVGPKTLRRKLRSFLSAEQIEALQNKELLSARDITIAHLFDKWSGGNLSSFVGPRLEELLEQDVKRLKSEKPKLPDVSLREVQTTIEALETLEMYQSNPSRHLSNPVVQRALKNLGISPSQVIAPTTKAAMGDIANEVHKFAEKRVKGHPRLGSGIRIRRNWGLHARASPEYLQSIPHSYPVKGIGGKTSVSSTYYSGRYSKGWKTDVPRTWQSSGSDSYDLSRAVGDYLSSEMQDFSDMGAEFEYGSNKALKAALSRSPDRVAEHYTDLITKYAGSVTPHEANMPLSQQERQIHQQDVTRYSESLKEYTSKFGNYYGRIFHDAGVPVDVGYKVIGLTNNMGYRDTVAKQVVDWYSSDTKRLERHIDWDFDKISPFSPSAVMQGLQQTFAMQPGIMRAVQKFMVPFPGGVSPANIPTEVSDIVDRLVSGEETIEGVKRVGIVGSKSFDSHLFMNKWLSKNWSDNLLMITSTEVGKDLQGKNIGAAFHASNWAHWQGALQHKLPVRFSKERYKKDLTTADVINASDEVIAFFDRANASRSDISQITKIRDAIGDKPLRIVWIPADTSRSDLKVNTPFGMEVMKAFGSLGNVSFDKFHPGYTSEANKSIPFKYLAKGGSLKPNENAIVGEHGPEALVPDGRGGFHVIPNNSLRYLAEGTLTLRRAARDVTGENQEDDHHYVDPVSGEVWKSVTEIQRRGAPEPDIPDYYSHVGSIAHYYAAKGIGKKFGVDTSHVTYPEVNPSQDFKGVMHSVAAMDRQGKIISDKFLELADKMGFIPALVERRLVDTEKKYSGTLDIGGFIRDEFGQLSPVIADFKSTTKVDKEKYAEQIAAYAMMFEDAVEGFVINVSRDLKHVQVVQVDLARGADRWRESLEIYNKVPKLKAPGFSANVPGSDAAWERFAELARTMVNIPTPEGPQSVTMLTLDPMHMTKAVGKYLPKYGTPEWDKNPARLQYYGARYDDLALRAANDRAAVHPDILAIIDKMEKHGVSHEILSAMMPKAKGTYEDDPGLIKFLNTQYDMVKKIVFSSKQPNEANTLEYLKWEDARTLANVLEEVGKAFSSMPDFSKSRYEPPVSAMPGQVTKRVPQQRESRLGLLLPKGSGEGWKFPEREVPAASSYKTRTKTPTSRSGICKRVDLCQKTLNALNAMISKSAARRMEVSSGAARRPYERKKKEFVPPPVVPPWKQMLEKLPFVGAPARAYREWGEAREAREMFNPDLGEYEDYLKLQQKEEIARGKYYRSIRGATTSFLIAQHVLRVFGQSSQVVNQGMSSIGRGLGYIGDMFLLPLVPIINPLVKGMINVGNIIRQFPAIGVLLIPILYKIGKSFYDFYTGIGKLPNILDRLTRSLDEFFARFSKTPEPTPGPVPAPVGEELPGEHEGSYSAGGWYQPRNRARRIPGVKMLPGETATEIPAGGTPGKGPSKKVSGKWYDKEGNEITSFRMGGKTGSDGLAYLHAGEVVVPSDVVKKVGYFAEGGAVSTTAGIASATTGSFSSLLTGAANLYTSALTSDIGQAALTGLSSVSRTIGAFMAPLAPAAALGVMGGKGLTMIKNAINRGNQVTTSVSENGFGSLRTMAAAQLVSLTSGLAPLIPIAAAVAGLYAWSQGYSVVVEGVLNGLKSILEMGKDLISKMFEWLKDRFKVETPKGAKTETRDEGKKEKKTEEAKTDRLSGEDLKKAEEDRKRRAKEEYEKSQRTEGTKAGEEVKTEDKPKSFLDKAKEALTKTGTGILSGVATMAGIGGIVGAMESNNPIEIAKSAGLGAVAQAGFNVLGKGIDKITKGVPGVGSAIMGGLGGFLAPDFGQTIGKAFISGEGPLAIGKYLGLKGNTTAEHAVGTIATQAFTGANVPANVGAYVSDLVGGTDLQGGIISQIGSDKMTGNYSMMGELYKFGYNNPNIAPLGAVMPGGGIVAAGGQMKSLSEGAQSLLGYTKATSSEPGNGEVVSKLDDINNNLKQPTINYNTIEMQNSDPYALFQQFLGWLTQTGYSSGVQKTG